MLMVRVAAASLAIGFSSLHAFGESSQIVAVSGRDQLALHDLATGAELARFDAPGGSSDLLALGSGIALSNHTAGNEVIVIDLKRPQRNRPAALVVARGHPSCSHVFEPSDRGAAVRRRSQRWE
jgi:hypothetical protein